MELEFAPTADLIDELCRRTNFAGVVIYQKDELRNVRPADIGCNRVRWSGTLTATKALVQMANATRQLTEAIKKEEQGNG